MPLAISLLIPAYNEEDNIGECLHYVIKNSQFKFAEIIVIDNASTDRTRQMAESVPGVRVVSEPHKGLTRARQRGFLEAKGEILAFIDADTRMPLGWSGQIEQCFAKPEVVAVSGPYTYFDLPKWQSGLVWLYWHLLGYTTYLMTGYMIVGGNFAISKKAVEQMGGFDTSIEFYGEDTNIARRVSRFGKVIFSLSLVMPTSGRRLKGEGFFKIGLIYASNFVSETILKRPSHSKYKDIR